MSVIFESLTIAHNFDVGQAAAVRANHLADRKRLEIAAPTGKLNVEIIDRKSKAFSNTRCQGWF